MSEVPEHLLKRAQEARDKAAAKKAAAAGGDAPAEGSADSGDSGSSSEADSRIPAHLLDPALFKFKRVRLTGIIEQNGQIKSHVCFLTEDPHLFIRIHMFDDLVHLFLRKQFVFAAGGWRIR